MKVKRRKLGGEESYASEQRDSIKFVTYTVDVLSPNEHVGCVQTFTPAQMS